MSPGLEPGEVQAQLDAVLADAPFAVSSDAGSILLWLKRWYDSTVTDLYLSSPVVFWLTMAALLLVLSLLVWHLSYSLSVVWRSVRKPPTAAALALAPKTGPDLGGARQALERGDHRRAVELAWQVVVGRLEAGLEGAPTPRQWARAASKRMSAGRAGDLLRLLSLHEGACYAGRPPSPAEAREALSAAEGLVGEAP